MHGLGRRCTLTVVPSLIRYRLQNERYVHRAGRWRSCRTPLGEFRMYRLRERGRHRRGVRKRQRITRCAGIWRSGARAAKPARRCWCACTCIAWRGIFWLVAMPATAGQRCRGRDARDCGGGLWRNCVSAPHAARALGVDRTVQPPRLVFHRSEGRVSGMNAARMDISECCGRWDWEGRFCRTFGYAGSRC